MDKIAKLQEMIDASKNIVFFGGAGVSTDSGIKDFRGSNGIYKEKNEYPPEYLLSSDCFYNDTELFYKFYKKSMNCLDAKPNKAHEYLKKLEDQGKLKAIVTQNIDGLHQKAGSKKVYEIHGTIYSNHCVKCHKYYDANEVFTADGIPRCSCGGIIKPDVTLYGEMLPEDYVKAIVAIGEADMLIVAGTSLVVEPASSLINYFNGKYLVIINYDETRYDNRANLVINDGISNVFSKLK